MCVMATEKPFVPFVRGRQKKTVWYATEQAKAQNAIYAKAQGQQIVPCAMGKENGDLAITFKHATIATAKEK